MTITTTKSKTYTVGRKVKNMEIILTIVFLFCVFVLPSMLTDHKFNNRTSPDGYKTDWAAMNHDLAMGKSKTGVKQKFNRGGYDIPDKK